MQFTIMSTKGTSHRFRMHQVLSRDTGCHTLLKAAFALGLLPEGSGPFAAGPRLEAPLLAFGVMGFPLKLPTRMARPPSVTGL